MICLGVSTSFLCQILFDCSLSMEFLDAKGAHGVMEPQKVGFLDLSWLLSSGWDQRVSIRSLADLDPTALLCSKCSTRKRLWQCILHRWCHHASLNPWKTSVRHAETEALELLAVPSLCFVTRGLESLSGCCRQPFRLRKAGVVSTCTKLCSSLPAGNEQTARDKALDTFGWKHMHCCQNAACIYASQPLLGASRYFSH